MSETNQGSAKTVHSVEYICGEANTKTVRGSIVSTFQMRPSDPTDKQILVLVEQSGVLDFWSNDEEDVYTHDDGEAI